MRKQPILICSVTILGESGRLIVSICSHFLLSKHVFSTIILLKPHELGTHEGTHVANSLGVVGLNGNSQMWNRRQRGRSKKISW